MSATLAPFGNVGQVFSTPLEVVDEQAQYTQDIVQIIEKHTGYGWPVIAGRSRGRRACFSRQTFWCFMRFGPFMPSLPEIGRMTGHDHTSVISGLRRMNEMILRERHPEAGQFALIAADAAIIHPQTAGIAMRLFDYARRGGVMLTARGQPANRDGARNDIQGLVLAELADGGWKSTVAVVCAINAPRELTIQEGAIHSALLALARKARIERRNIRRPSRNPLITGRVESSELWRIREKA